MGRYVVAPLREVPPGTRKVVDVGARSVVIFNIAGELFGLLRRCPHQGGDLSQGRLIGLVQSNVPGQYCLSRCGEILRCPWHGWEFDVRTGQSWCDPARIKTRSYEVGLEAGQTLIKGPYVAEVLQVNVHEDYIVIEV
jgi:nitrite reductase/ring-hydroxylating ferredoxin subunit